MVKMKHVVMAAALAAGAFFAVNTDAEAAGQIQGVQQTDAGTGSVSIRWDSDLASERYIVEISNDKAEWFVENDTSLTSMTISSLSPGKSYYIRVGGYTWNWLTDSGTLVTEVSEPLEVVTAPSDSNMTVTQSDATTSSFSVGFSECSGANLYRIYNNFQKDILLGESTTPTVKVDGLTAGTEYNCYAYACRKSASGFVAEGGESSYGTHKSYKTLAEKIDKKSFNVSQTSNSIDVYYFSATATGTVDGYQLQFLTPAGKSKKTFTEKSYSFTQSVSFRIANFLNGNFYQYRVRTYVECGTEKVYSAWSARRYIGVMKTPSTNNKKNAVSFSWGKISGATKYVVQMSTKEASGYKKIKTTNAKNRSVTVTKFNGKKIKSGKYYIRIYAYAKIGGKTVKTEVPSWSGYYQKY